MCIFCLETSLKTMMDLIAFLSFKLQGATTFSNYCLITPCTTTTSITGSMASRRTSSTCFCPIINSSERQTKTGSSLKATPSKATTKAPSSINSSRLDWTASIGIGTRFFALLQNSTSVILRLTTRRQDSNKEGWHPLCGDLWPRRPGDRGSGAHRWKGAAGRHAGHSAGEQMWGQRSDQDTNDVEL